MEYASLVKSTFANLYIAYSRRLLSIGDCVENRSSASEFRKYGRMSNYESFFEAINELGWEHVSIRYN